jgi:hypothetical protein
MAQARPAENRHTARYRATVACLVFLTLAGLAGPLYTAAHLLRGPSPARLEWERRIAGLVLGIACLYLAIGLIGIVLGVHPPAGWLVGR